jgi:hypothetical protein
VQSRTGWAEPGISSSKHARVSSEELRLVSKARIAQFASCLGLDERMAAGVLFEQDDSKDSPSWLSKAILRIIQMHTGELAGEHFEQAGSKFTSPFGR